MRILLVEADCHLSTSLLKTVELMQLTVDIASDGEASAETDQHHNNFKLESFAA